MKMKRLVAAIATAIAFAAAVPAKANNPVVAALATVAVATYGAYLVSARKSAAD